MIRNSNDETNFAHNILITEIQVSKICKDFAKGSSTITKFSKTHLSKILQPGGFLKDISSVTSSLDNIFKFPFEVLNSYSN